ncbi:3-dehydroquinate synthase family protein [Streptomyces sp. SL13]|uniref:2-deoxy-scyllo-inosose synthase n=1 Tax=Streptantibioticus silvisoli TaxID=2705255 RepID=A0AA90JZW1_9ACTN|nr:3-dehydroquinate synthase family protein [Streptantibioticus silvisoli]MDI5962180.1 3-dehydroquinate synthase family protein [Streptantibioticus silvisoli]MDI5972446.1 3-dehydroquinate synthase family protein [Streptantibioticus silvisoli]
MPILGSAQRLDQYPVDVCRDEPAAVRSLLGRIDGRRVAMVTDDSVAALHARRLAGLLGGQGVDVAMTSFAAGEASKSVPTAVGLLDWLAGTELARRDVVLAVGGGVVIDTVGWVASAYMRGVPYCNVPTTLLAQVDASLGGKVAVDHPSAKNLIGSFHQPMGVVSNVGYLATLDRRQMRAGLAEAIKKGVIASPALFALIEREYRAILAAEPEVTARLVHGASLIKCQLIAKDPYEEDLRRPLNFGHTIGHAVETVTDYGPVLHGEAVAFGMACAARIAERRGLLAPAAGRRVTGLLERVGLPTVLGDLPAPLDPAAVVSALGQIRKIRDGHLRFVLPVTLGETLITDDVTDDEIRAALTAVRPGNGNANGHGNTNGHGHVNANGDADA